METTPVIVEDDTGLLADSPFGQHRGKLIERSQSAIDMTVGIDNIVRTQVNGSGDVSLVVGVSGANIDNAHIGLADEAFQFAGGG